MEIIVLRLAGEFLELVDFTIGSKSPEAVPESVRQSIDDIRKKLANKAINAVPPVLDLLEIAYRYACSGQVADNAAAIHEGLYNASVRAALPLLFIIWGPFDPRTRKLFAGLIPDAKIREAFVTQTPTTVGLVHKAEVQLGYLRRRTSSLRQLISALDAHRDRLPIERPKTFEEYLILLRRLADVADGIPKFDL